MSHELLRIERGAIHFDTDRAEVGHIYRVAHRPHYGNQRPHALCGVLDSRERGITFRFFEEPPEDLGGYPVTSRLSCGKP